MSVGKVSDPSGKKAAQTLSEIARELDRVRSALAARTEGNDAEAESVEEWKEALARLSERLDDWQAQEEGSETEAAHLRQKILDALARGGPALPIELAAATLSLPEEVGPVLEAMDREGLIQIRGVRGGQLVTLTAKGRMEVHH